jgi:hypothetical protein
MLLDYAKFFADNLEKSYIEICDHNIDPLFGGGEFRIK